jgi:type II protein arginine methyltransferase
MTDDWLAHLEIPESLAPFCKQLEGRPDEAIKLAEIAITLTEKVSEADCIMIALRARLMSTENSLPWLLTQSLFDSVLPSYHSRMLSDDKRNNAYATAIADSINSDHTVLEVGTGTGILALFAARAGAKHVYTIERSPLLAEIARQNIRLGGYSDRITVINKDFEDIEIGVDIPERCNCFLHEVLGNKLIDEHVFPLTKLAQEKYLLPARLHVPNSCRLQLALHPDFKEPKHSTICDVDISAFNITKTKETRTDHNFKIPPLSNPTPALSVMLNDFEMPSHDIQKISFTATQTGTVKAIRIWFQLGFPNGTIFENTDQPKGITHWPHTLNSVTPKDVQKGDIVTYGLRYKDTQVFLFDLD